jgi:putative transposase
MQFQPFRGDKEVISYKTHLPHWRQELVTYFVTFRLGDSIPQTKLSAWLQERECWMRSKGIALESSVESFNEEARLEYHRRFTKRFHEWLDAGMGECLLRRPELAGIVASAFSCFQGSRYVLDSWVVMPNHVHVLLCPHEEHPLENILHSWKSFTAHEINKMLQRAGSLWQRESFDHIVRSEQQLNHFRRYISENPVKARLEAGSYLLSDRSGE